MAVPDIPILARIIAKKHALMDEQLAAATKARVPHVQVEHASYVRLSPEAFEAVQKWADEVKADLVKSKKVPARELERYGESFAGLTLVKDDSLVGEQTFQVV